MAADRRTGFGRGEEIVAVRPQFLAAQQRPGRGRKPAHHLCCMARWATKVPIGVPGVPRQAAYREGTYGLNSGSAQVSAGSFEAASGPHR